MSRRGPSMYTLMRQAAAAQRAQEAQLRRQEREWERARAQAEREAKREYLEERKREADEHNEDVAGRIEELGTILEHAENIDPKTIFAELRDTKPFPAFAPDGKLVNASPAPVLERYLGAVSRPIWLVSWIPSVKQKHEAALDRAHREWTDAVEDHKSTEAEREHQLAESRKHYEIAKSEYEAKQRERNQDIADFAASYAQGVPETVASVAGLVLDRSSYPEGFPSEVRTAFVPESKQLVVDFELPSPSVVPAVAEYKYVRARDAIDEKPRKANEIKDIYQDVVAAVALRAIAEVFASDLDERIAVAVFNGMLRTVDPSTGRDIRPCLISVRATRERFREIDIRRVDRRACLRNLGAQVSPRANEAQPVKPIVDFDMVDKRFVDQADVLGDLESRPNLMDLNPFEFEALTSNLFQRMGLETKLTRSSRDGGVDAVAFDARPVLGGKVVIQAKRYKNTVGVSAVRDLFGTMMNEGANKGILVTTSGYGPDAYDFAKDKPVELIDGGGLLYLLEEHGVKARIVFPDDGVDAGA